MAITQRQPPKTWSLLGETRRKPTPYEVVTAKFHYHFRRDPAPFELDPDTPLNAWYLRYREGSAFNVDDWEGFRDPVKLTYKDYVLLQHDREVYLDGVIDRFEGDLAQKEASPGWLTTVGELVVPLRFALHVLQMVGLYVGQMAPSSFITNAAHFQAADEMRRIQRLAYWTKAMANAYDDRLATTELARQRWEEAPAWQPLRRGLEELLIAYDWGEAFAALNLAMKPAIDAVVNGQLASLAAANGDTLLAGILEDFDQDTRRSQQWTAALVAYATNRDPSMAAVLDGYRQRWDAAAMAGVQGLAPLFEHAPVPIPAAEVVDSARRAHRQSLEPA